MTIPILIGSFEAPWLVDEDVELEEPEVEVDPPSPLDPHATTPKIRRQAPAAAHTNRMPYLVFLIARLSSFSVSGAGHHLLGSPAPAESTGNAVVEGPLADLPATGKSMARDRSATGGLSPRPKRVPGASPRIAESIHFPAGGINRPGVK
ncbi:MAG: hypothetical protein J0H06_14980 [Actinobacteria bacterium]|nr:hypothetical protein [Actinomycetota bacterium]